ncbi:MAG: UDP-N-acetylglucosamine--N-acetylmuramyl-(pentapeptide) pyrophosphoryl-undecaprenol N-acetylglucosamine transferase [Syntrophorhabdaceae bacterium PtaU1.Bin034]|jgi:UDP-N-acetylglucosamine--N-acetylmuramyl-(pentapeptide) pyrophosphoryl-undecaprenol N-acetylglucosamine transferase|nr:MAG: UDP-N-acetylglucosamine--N-acetylmuramyl-(pentapeptide) pyrophosphoryl-undecaprenol N-acetylglucosamine transferase [Syntrophorhabdaceae bacterium PtaU1.Bin034]
MKLLIAAGGTGGHIFPGVSVAEAFAADKGNEVFFTGTPYGLEERLIPGYGFRLIKIEAKPFTGRSPADKAKTVLAVVKGTTQAIRVIKTEKPDAILGMGGFTSVPVVLAGLLLRKPCFIHEQNVIPGMANKLLARKVKATFISFDDTAKYLRARDVIHTGNPIRRNMRGKRGEKPDRNFNIFVFGGSRGARSINNAVLQLLPYLEAFKQTVLYHQTGGEDFERIKGGYEGFGTSHQVFAFTDEMEKYYNLADVVVARAGASTIFELAYFGKPAILVPYPFSAGGHQWKNASYVERAGGGHVIGNDELSGERLYTAITELRENPEELGRMSENIRSIYVEDAEQKVVRGIQARVS